MPTQLITIILILYICILCCRKICFYTYPLIRTKNLTGLYLAGPAFTCESCEVRFCKGDAVFTEAVYTNGHPSIGAETYDEDGRNMRF